MYYLELIQRFWEFNKTTKVSPTEISLYFYLLKIGYDNDRYDFKISDVKLGKDLGLTRKTIKSTKEKLKQLGLILFQCKNGVPCHYRLLLNYSFKIDAEKSIKIEESTNVEKPRKSKTSIISPEIFLSTPNTLQVLQEIEINNDGKISPELSQNQKFDMKYIQKYEREDEQEQELQNLKNRKIPSLDEFMEYARSLECYERELDLSISEKYETWNNNGWKNTSNRPISNWKSTLKSTLPYLKNSNVENTSLLQNIPNIKRPES